MEDKKFKEKLSTIGSWYIPIVNETTSASRKPQINSQTNPLLGPIIDKLNPCLKPCQWCNRIVDQYCTHNLRIGRGEPYWEHNCKTCGRQWDPKTNKVIEKAKTAYQLAKELHEQGLATKRSYWWNDSSVYTDSDKNKPGKNEA
jgi:hypothetical protein